MSSEVVILAGAALRDYTIAEAHRMQAQALAMVGGYEELRDECANAVTRLNALQASLTEALARTQFALTRADAFVAQFTREAGVLAQIAAKLESQKASGQEPASGSLTTLYQ